MRLKIVSVGESVLRATSQELSKEQILSPSIQNLIEYMRETLRDAPGVGLAAPQVGESLQLAVIEDKADYHKLLTESELKERGRSEVPFHVIVNPAIEVVTETPETFFEGCLSLPGFTALVPRARQVRVRCLDHRENLRSLMLPDGMPAYSCTRSIICTASSISIRCGPRVFSTLENYTRHWKSLPLKVAAENCSSS